MVRFRDNPKPPDYSSRRQQWRLLVLAMSLGLVLILANEARKPANWAWFDRLAQPPQSLPAPPRQAARPAQDPPGVVRLSVPEPSDRPAKDASVEPPGRYFPGVKADWLASIEDNTVFRPQESAAWFGLLEILARTDPDTLVRASAGHVSRLQLAEQSAAYRGEVVSLRGTVRRALRKAAPENEAGIAGYYQVWLQPDDSPDWPVVLYCLELPEGFPVGTRLSERAGVTGFYFKRWLYPSQRGSEVAPLVLARSLDWQPLPPPAAPPGGRAGLFVVLGASAALAVAAVLYVRWRSGGRVPPRRSRPEVVIPDVSEGKARSAEVGPS